MPCSPWACRTTTSKNIESFFNISYDTICKIQKPRSVATSCQDILMEYFREHEMLDAAVDGRMTILPPCRAMTAF